MSINVSPTTIYIVTESPSPTLDLRASPLLRKELVTYDDLKAELGNESGLENSRFRCTIIEGNTVEIEILKGDFVLAQSESGGGGSASGEEKRDYSYKEFKSEILSSKRNLEGGFPELKKPLSISFIKFQQLQEIFQATEEQKERLLAAHIAQNLRKKIKEGSDLGKPFCEFLELIKHYSQLNVKSIIEIYNELFGDKANRASIIDPKWDSVLKILLERTAWDEVSETSMFINSQFFIYYPQTVLSLEAQDQTTKLLIEKMFSKLKNENVLTILLKSQSPTLYRYLIEMKRAERVPEDHSSGFEPLRNLFTKHFEILFTESDQKEITTFFAQLKELALEEGENQKDFQELLRDILHEGNLWLNQKESLKVGDLCSLLTIMDYAAQFELDSTQQSALNFFIEKMPKSIEEIKAHDLHPGTAKLYLNQFFNIFSSLDRKMNCEEALLATVCFFPLLAAKLDISDLFDRLMTYLNDFSKKEGCKFLERLSVLTDDLNLLSAFLKKVMASSKEAKLQTFYLTLSRTFSKSEMDSEEKFRLNLLYYYIRNKKPTFVDIDNFNWILRLHPKLFTFCIKTQIFESALKLDIKVPSLFNVSIPGVEFEDSTLISQEEYIHFIESSDFALSLKENLLKLWNKPFDEDEPSHLQHHMRQIISKVIKLFEEKQLSSRAVRTFFSNIQNESEMCWQGVCEKLNKEFKALTLSLQNKEGAIQYPLLHVEKSPLCSLDRIKALLTTYIQNKDNVGSFLDFLFERSSSSPLVFNIFDGVHKEFGNLIFSALSLLDQQAVSEDQMKEFFISIEKVFVEFISDFSMRVYRRRGYITNNLNKSVKLLESRLPDTVFEQLKEGFDPKKFLDEFESFFSEHVQKGATIKYFFDKLNVFKIIDFKSSYIEDQLYPVLYAIMKIYTMSKENDVEDSKFKEEELISLINSTLSFVENELLTIGESSRVQFCFIYRQTQEAYSILTRSLQEEKLKTETFPPEEFDRLNERLEACTEGGDQEDYDRYYSKLEPCKERLNEIATQLLKNSSYDALEALRRLHEEYSKVIPVVDKQWSDELKEALVKLNQEKFTIRQISLIEILLKEPNGISLEEYFVKFNVPQNRLVRELFVKSTFTVLEADTILHKKEDKFYLNLENETLIEIKKYLESNYHTESYSLEKALKQGLKIAVEHHEIYQEAKLKKEGHSLKLSLLNVGTQFLEEWVDSNLPTFLISAVKPYIPHHLNQQFEISSDRWRKQPDQLLEVIRKNLVKLFEPASLRRQIVETILYRGNEVHVTTAIKSILARSCGFSLAQLETYSQQYKDIPGFYGAIESIREILAHPTTKFKVSLLEFFTNSLLGTANSDLNNIDHYSTIHAIIARAIKDRVANPDLHEKILESCFTEEKFDEEGEIIMKPRITLFGTNFLLQSLGLVETKGELQASFSHAKLQRMNLDQLDSTAYSGDGGGGGAK